MNLIKRDNFLIKRNHAKLFFDMLKKFNLTEFLSALFKVQLLRSCGVFFICTPRTSFGAIQIRLLRSR